MNIYSKDYGDTLTYLLKQRWGNGDEFVAFLMDAVVAPQHELYCFGSLYDVQEFCYESSTDLDIYDYLSIRSVCRTMSEALQDKTFLIEKDGITDIGAMVSEHFRRLETQQSNNNHQKNHVMINENFEYLKDQVKFTGFGIKESMHEELKEKMMSGVNELTIKVNSLYGKDVTDSTLYFKKSANSEMYFFNSFEMELLKENSAESIRQKFYVDKNNLVTQKEAYNLLDGRDVFREGMVNKDKGEFTAWRTLEVDTDGKLKFRYSKDFDLDKVLTAYPIKQLQNETEKSHLRESLERGNRHAVTFIVNGEEKPYFIEVTAKHKSINIYDENMVRLRQKESLALMKPSQNIQQEGDAKIEKAQVAQNDSQEQKSSASKKTKNDAPAQDQKTAEKKTAKPKRLKVRS
jgi:hypothetical protein